MVRKSLAIELLARDWKHEARTSFEHRSVLEMHCKVVRIKEMCSQRVREEVREQAAFTKAECAKESKMAWSVGSIPTDLKFSLGKRCAFKTNQIRGLVAIQAPPSLPSKIHFYITCHVAGDLGKAHRQTLIILQCLKCHSCIMHFLGNSIPPEVAIGHNLGVQSTSMLNVSGDLDAMLVGSLP